MEFLTSIQMYIGTILIMKTAVTLTFSSVNDQVGVTLSLRGSAVANNSYVNVADIGNTDGGALLCCTDKPGCCANENREGHWYFPDGKIVPYYIHRQGFRRDKGDGVVRLKQNGMSTDRGLFYCEVPDANDTNRTVYVHIVEPVMITGCHSHACTQTTAEIGFTLNCSASVPNTNVTLDLIFDWLFGPMNEAVSSPFNSSTAINGNNGTYISILSFPTLQPSHAGKYTCKIRGTQNLMAHVNITVKDISVKIIGSGSTTPGHNTSLTCMVDGLNVNLDASVTYQWSKANEILTQIRTVSPDLSFAPLRLSDAGNYTCQVIVDSNRLNRSINVATFKIMYVEIPIRVYLSHSPLPPDLTTEGECTTFTCTVELGPCLVDSDLSLIEVDAQLYRDGAPLALSGPTVVTDTTLTYSTQLDLSVRNNSESYTCTATVRPRDESAYVNASTNVSDAVVTITSTGLYISLGRKTYVNNSNILITDIGEGRGHVLHCFTNLKQCCRSDQDQTINGTDLGEWFYPNSSTIGLNVSNENFYTNRGRSKICLHRRGNSTSESLMGKFCCEIPDANYTLIKLCVNLVKDPSNTNLNMLTKCGHPTYTEQVSTDRISTLPVADHDLAAVAIGGGLTVVVVIVTTTSAIILVCVMRRCRLKSSKAHFRASAADDDIAMAPNDVYTIAVKIHCDENTSYGVINQRASYNV